MRSEPSRRTADPVEQRRLTRALDAFLGPTAGPARFEAVGGGHIHGSWKVQLNDRALLLQQVNTRVFPDPRALASNLQRVTRRLRDAFRGGPYRTLTPVPALQGGLLVESEDESEDAWWRAFEFLDGLHAHTQPTSTAMVAEAGRAFGAFSQALQGLSPSELAIPIPGFHSLSLRRRQLREAARRTRLDLRRAPESARLLELADALTEQLLPLEQAAIDGALPTRIVHNDAKLDNLLFDAAGRAVCVVDLDTVMPGIAHYDIGDSLRTLVPDRVEDDPDAEGIELDMGRHGAYLEGYLERADLEPHERRMLPYAAPYMACIMGVRFLADHLAGNVYYRTARPGHNLDRARNQLILARKFLHAAPLSSWR